MKDNKEKENEEIIVEEDSKDINEEITIEEDLKGINEEITVDEDSKSIKKKKTKKDKNQEEDMALLFEDEKTNPVPIILLSIIIITIMGFGIFLATKKITKTIKTEQEKY